MTCDLFGMHHRSVTFHIECTWKKVYLRIRESEDGWPSMPGSRVFDNLITVSVRSPLLGESEQGFNCRKEMEVEINDGELRSSSKLTILSVSSVWLLLNSETNTLTAAYNNHNRWEPAQSSNGVFLFDFRYISTSSIPHLAEVLSTEKFQSMSVKTSIIPLNAVTNSLVKTLHGKGSEVAVYINTSSRSRSFIEIIKLLSLSPVDYVIPLPGLFSKSDLVFIEKIVLEISNKRSHLMEELSTCNQLYETDQLQQVLKSCNQVESYKESNEDIDSSERGDASLPSETLISDPQNNALKKLSSRLSATNYILSSAVGSRFDGKNLIRGYKSPSDFILLLATWISTNVYAVPIPVVLVTECLFASVIENFISIVQTTSSDRYNKLISVDNNLHVYKKVDGILLLNTSTETKTFSVSTDSRPRRILTSTIQQQSCLVKLWTTDEVFPSASEMVFLNQRRVDDTLIKGFNFQSVEYYKNDLELMSPVPYKNDTWSDEETDSESTESEKVVVEQNSSFQDLSIQKESHSGIDDDQGELSDRNQKNISTSRASQETYLSDCSSSCVENSSTESDEGESLSNIKDSGWMNASGSMASIELYIQTVVSKVGVREKRRLHEVRRRKLEEQQTHREDRSSEALSRNALLKSLAIITRLRNKPNLIQRSSIDWNNLTNQIRRGGRSSKFGQLRKRSSNFQYADGTEMTLEDQLVAEFASGVVYTKSLQQLQLEFDKLRNQVEGSDVVLNSALADEEETLQMPEERLNVLRDTLSTAMKDKISVIKMKRRLLDKAELIKTIHSKTLLTIKESQSGIPDADIESLIADAINITKKKTKRGRKPVVDIKRVEAKRKAQKLLQQERERHAIMLRMKRTSQAKQLQAIAGGAAR